jgi:3-hydroxyisobutyrate dehydrogenase-like beta-hydroxyacid dehydrogenase
MTAESICVLGLGLMGRPLAREFTSSGHDVRGWNRSQLAPELVAGITVVPDLEQAAAAETLVLMLLDSGAVGEVLASLEPHLRAGQLLVDMGTSRPADSAERAARLAERGIGWVDAPVSGGPPAILQRRLAIMAGGSNDDVQRAERLLSPLGRVVHVGGPGAGHAVKLVNQVVVPLTIEAVAEALALAERCGLDLEVVRDALRGGSADSRILEVHASRMIAHDYTPAAHATIMLKDLLLVEEVAASVGLDLPHVESTRGRYEELVARGEGELDSTALHKLLLD